MTFAEIVGSLINRPFKPGGSTDEGLDCIGLCWRVAKAQGKAVPDRWREYDIENPTYQDLKGPAFLRTVLDLFSDIGEAVEPNYVVAGDWLLCRSTQAEGEYFLALYGGNGNVIASYTDSGVKVYSLRGMTIEIVRAVRLRDGRG